MAQKALLRWISFQADLDSADELDRLVGRAIGISPLADRTGEIDFRILVDAGPGRGIFAGTDRSKRTTDSPGKSWALSSRATSARANR